VLIDSAQVDPSGATKHLLSLAGEPHEEATAIGRTLASLHQALALDSIDESGGSAPTEAYLFGKL
jgi:predicted trehalose synthase